jgi:hypothetical protein
MANLVTVVDVVEGAIGDTLTPALLKRHRGLDVAIRQRIAERHAEYEHSPAQLTVPKREPLEVFPYVHPGWTVSDDLGAAPARETHEQAVAAIKTLLLYYHRLAVPSALGDVCDYYSGGRFMDAAEPAARAFESQLYLLAELRPLVQSGTIFFMPEPSTYGPAVDAVARLGTPEWIYEIDRDDAGIMMRLREIFEQSMFIGGTWDLDLLIPNGPAAESFGQFVTHTAHRISKVELAESQLGSMLLHCDLPMLDALTVKDIAAIRTDSTAFARWRSQLRSVLRAFYEDFASGAMDQRQFRRYAAEELADGKSRIEAEIRQSSYLSLASAGLKSVGIGTVVAGLTAPADAATGIASAVVTGGVTFLVDCCRQKMSRGAKVAQSLRAHYAVLTETRHDG